MRPSVVDYVRLPDELEIGLYDQFGNPLPDSAVPARLVVDLTPPAPIYHFWAVFARPIAPGTVGIMTFLNLPGDLPASGAFTEWDRGENVPVLRDAVLTRMSVQRGTGAARVAARNDSPDPRVCAAGIVIGSLGSIARGGGKE